MLIKSCSVHRPFETTLTTLSLLFEQSCSKLVNLLRLILLSAFYYHPTVTEWLRWCSHMHTDAYMYTFVGYIVCIPVLTLVLRLNPQAAVQTVPLLKPAPPAARLSRITQSFHIHVYRPVSTAYAQTHTLPLSSSLSACN